YLVLLLDAAQAPRGAESSSRCLDSSQSDGGAGAPRSGGSVLPPSRDLGVSVPGGSGAASVGGAMRPAGPGAPSVRGPMPAAGGPERSGAGGLPVRADESASTPTWPGCSG